MSTSTKRRSDLTRWNRAGLSRFDYVDGDAAVWLEELRIALLGLYLRGGDDATRLPEHWRDAFLRDPADWPDAAGAATRVAWTRLAPDMPPQRETRGRRTERLLRQYAEHTDDITWEITRAFARAAHVLLGTLDAYANEGYLRTATQWDTLRRLATMVNYQPTPPASATTTVGLILDEAAGAVSIPAGLAMKHTPPEGGAPLVFETLAEVSAHPALNAARAVAWNQNPTAIAFGTGGGVWHLPADKTLATGDLAVLARGTRAEALALAQVDPDTEAGRVTLRFDMAPKETYPHHETRLWVHPGDLRIGLRASKDRQVVVEVEKFGGAVAGDLVEVFIGNTSTVVEVLAARGTDLVLDMALPEDDAPIMLRAMLPFALDAEGTTDRIASAGARMWRATGGAPLALTGSVVPADEKPVAGLRRYRFGRTGAKRAFAPDSGGAKISGRIRRKRPTVLPERADAGARTARLGARTVSFEGKPPKGLADGDWFVARDMATGAIKALRVTGLRVAAGEYHVAFDAAPLGAPERTEFHGPMRRALRHEGHDRNPGSAFSGNTVTLDAIPEPARVLIKPGRSVLIRAQHGDTDQTVAARVIEARARPGDRIELALTGYDAAATWARGDMTFALNTAQISHGETKNSKILGSGDGERRAQVFDFDIRNVSHIPSTAAESGVVPDMTIAVDGERWDYRDFIDPAAAGARAWSSTLTDTGTLRIHFRRRLVTGQNNVTVTRYRVGAGAAGSNIPPQSFTKPMRKHRHVAGIFQPFATAGGADREPVAKLREAAPRHLAANGRAVSLQDFEHLATRHAAILRAHADLVPTAGAQRVVALTVALSDGGSVQGIAADLVPAITARALPGVGVTFRDYEHLPLHMAVTVRADLSVHNRTDIMAAAHARLTEEFGLARRAFGQTAYISEVLAALETVDGIETAIVDSFGLGQAYDLLAPKPAGSTRPWPRNVATIDGRIAAIYATDHQIIHIAAGASGAVAIQVETTT